MEEKSHRLQIIIALIGVIGVLGSAIVSNWDKIFSSPKSAAPVEKPFVQSSSGSSSPNVSNVQGDVNINISKEESRLIVPDFSGNIDSASQSDLFERFVDSNRGKIVHVNVSMDQAFSEYDEENHTVALSSEPCTSEYFNIDCVSFRIVIKGDNNILEMYKGDTRISGYFSIEENVWMAQGVNYLLKSIPKEKILLQTQRSAH